MTPDFNSDGISASDAGAYGLLLRRPWELEDVDVDVAKLLDDCALDSYGEPIPQRWCAIQPLDTAEVIGSIFITSPSRALPLLSVAASQ